MANPQRVAKILNDLWIGFMNQELMLYNQDPSEEDKKLFDSLIMECRKDMLDMNILNCPNRTTYVRHYDDRKFSIGMLNSDKEFLSIYTIDKDGDFIKRNFIKPVPMKDIEDNFVI